MVDVEPELVDVPEPEPDPEEEDDDELPVEREPAEEVLVDLRTPVPTTVPLPAERPVLAEPPVGFMMGVTKVEFWPAGTTAAEDWAVATAG